jgi:hypothetical protein
MPKVLKFRTSAVVLVLSILLWGFAHRSCLDALGEMPNPIGVVWDLATSIPERGNELPRTFGADGPNLL